ncbi:hypothetical protein [Aquimarina algicola]|uniref:Uncharacterized protein n=1 Tax=Aquimarina algicola TaxID=2589995 RepID=A0A504JQF0_9FLAO|nr:hypothetical protein [Aquimarina algicola]TPN89021.1 hypothetical protein FHK87_02040 [Aquimarina algicola]
MYKITPDQEFNNRSLDSKYHEMWNRGKHILTINDRNRDFYYCFFSIDNLFYVKAVYNKVNEKIIAIKSFTDTSELLFYLREDFS